MKSSLLNGVKTYAPQSPEELMCYAMKHHKIMIAVNAEKILHATDNSRIIINRNLGYPMVSVQFGPYEIKGLKML